MVFKARPNATIDMSELNQFKAEFFKALSHPLRIRILDELRKGEAGVNVLSTRLDVEQSSLSAFATCSANSKRIHSLIAQHNSRAFDMHIFVYTERRLQQTGLRRVLL